MKMKVKDAMMALGAIDDNDEVNIDFDLESYVKKLSVVATPVISLKTNNGVTNSVHAKLSVGCSFSGLDKEQVIRVLCERVSEETGLEWDMAYKVAKSIYIRDIDSMRKSLLACILPGTEDGRTE